MPFRSNAPKVTAPPPVTLALLADHPERVEELARWLEAEWPEWYGPEGPGDARAHMSEAAQRDGLPLALIALRGEALVGVAALRAEDGAAAQTALGPWVGSGLVRAELRGQGIGAMLLGAAAREARRLGFGTIYCSTRSAQRLLEREGWEPLGAITHEGAPLSVYRKAVAGGDGR